MLKSIATTSLVVATLASDEASFANFTKTYKKEYSTDEVASRFSAFRASLAKIAAHDSSKGYSLGINQFSDMTDEEFAKTYRTLKQPSPYSVMDIPDHVLSYSSYPDSLDWTSKGAVTPVKNQGQCGSCWSFGTTGALEGAEFVKHGKLVSLSEQALVDCNTGNGGCGGGVLSVAYDWINNNGIPTEESYPYVAKGQNCHAFQNAQISNITSYAKIQGSEKYLMDAVQKGPVAIGVDAGGPFMAYKSGILQQTSGTSVDHAVLLVGYGQENGIKYWKIKNSWDTTWGEEGYIRMIRDVNACGIASGLSLYPIV